jgi:hypothetical protein
MQQVVKVVVVRILSKLHQKQVPNEWFCKLGMEEMSKSYLEADDVVTLENQVTNLRDRLLISAPL